MGGYAHSKEVLETLVCSDVYLDTSLSSHRLDERDNLLTILKKHRPDRILFATDTPWSQTQNELNFIYSANLSPEFTENILFRNAQNLLNI
jgi:predicted TIM-barrel fold metal-dependent hydrolase